eukprot:SAG11_NODE_1215_length_5501_cov_4.190820_8_plen_103_part_00
MVFHETDHWQMLGVSSLDSLSSIFPLLGLHVGSMSPRRRSVSCLWWSVLLGVIYYFHNYNLAFLVAFQKSAATLTFCVPFCLIGTQSKLDLFVYLFTDLVHN